MLGFLQRPLLRVVAAAVLLTVIQSTWFSDHRLFSARLDVLLAASLAAGVAGGAEVGAVMGFVLGLGGDVGVTTPFGLSCLAYCVAGFAVGLVQDLVHERAWWLTMILCCVGSVLGYWIFVFGLAVVGFRGVVRPGLIEPSIVVGLANAVLGLGLVPVMRWCHRISKDPNAATAAAIARGA